MEAPISIKKIESNQQIISTATQFQILAENSKDNQNVNQGNDEKK